MMTDNKFYSQQSLPLTEPGCGDESRMYFKCRYGDTM